MQKIVKRKKLVLKRWVRILVLCMLILFTCIALYLIYTGLNPKQDKKPYYSYNVNRNIDYKVYLKENSFYEEPYIEKGKQYTSELIDYIDIDLGYLYNGSSISNINYDYDVTATIIGEYENTSNGKSELWTKKYKLLENQSKQVYDTTSFDINQNLKIDYDKYNMVVDDFKKQFKLAIDSYLNIKLDIKYNGIIQSSKKEIKGTDKLEINIPLSKSTINIDTDYDEQTSKSLTPTISELRNMKKVYVGICLLIIVLIMIITLHDKIFVNKKTYYEKMLSKILKDYADIIVEISTPANFENLEILEIKNFEDMLDLEEELKSPILLYEVESDRESWFVVINDKYAYRYILNSNSYYK